MCLTFIHSEDIHVLAMVSGDSCSCGTPRQVHRQLQCSLVSAKMGEVWGVMGVNRKFLG